jgi:hypothetical protein
MVADSYANSQSLASRLLEAGSAGIVYPSVRRIAGICLACFRPPPVSNVREAAPVRFTFANLKKLLKQNRATFEPGLKELGLEEKDEEYRIAIKIYETLSRDPGQTMRSQLLSHSFPAPINPSGKVLLNQRGQPFRSIFLRESGFALAPTRMNRSRRHLSFLRTRRSHHDCKPHRQLPAKATYFTIIKRNGVRR